MTQTRPQPERIDYGMEDSQWGELLLPGRAGPHPVVVLLHGGFWRAMYGLDLMRPLAADLAERGFATWNVEYRRVGEPGGGYPGTLDDVSNAIEHLRSLSGADLALDRLAVVGHSAGGHLALWTAGRSGLGPSDPGAGPNVEPVLAVSLAGVANLYGAASARYSNGATQQFLGGEPSEVPERYRVAQPDLAAASAPLVVIHGTADESVPIEQSHFAAARGADLHVVPGADHMDVIDPTHPAWHLVADLLTTALL